MSFKNVTVVESVDPNKSISSYKSFECEYDSSEFDDVNIDEGERPLYKYYMTNNSNDIRMMVKKSKS